LASDPSSVYQYRAGVSREKYREIGQIFSLTSPRNFGNL